MTISMTLLHAEETVAGPVVVHSDSMSTLKTIVHDRCIDNVRLLTSIWGTLWALESVGHHATLN